MSELYVHSTSLIDVDVEKGEGTKVRCFCNIHPEARIGKNVSNNVQSSGEIKF